MKKLLIAGGAVAGAIYVARDRLLRGDGFDFGGLIERMPDDAPPKWMFNNITAIRENTERILRLLESQPGPGGGPE